eukprot:TRINITY_DN1036_c0_g1_i4.p1 TRINITY_DN1036_c0_g1~~TRINITY_DN1036_c0_g1_i4.p1  ORF type:complete len:145 (-),score=30.35 TRINITY_DN1036_c0_g1_i4:24-458(-)
MCSCAHAQASHPMRVGIETKDPTPEVNLAQLHANPGDCSPLNQHHTPALFRGLSCAMESVNQICQLWTAHELAVLGPTLPLKPNESALVEENQCRGAHHAREAITNILAVSIHPVSYTHLRAHETPEHLVCRLLLEKKKKKTIC